MTICSLLEDLPTYGWILGQHELELTVRARTKHFIGVNIGNNAAALCGTDYKERKKKKIVYCLDLLSTTFQHHGLFLEDQTYVRRNNRPATLDCICKTAVGIPNKGNCKTVKSCMNIKGFPPLTIPLHPS